MDMSTPASALVVGIVLGMEQTEWASRWSVGRIGFHQSDINRQLLAHADAVWGELVGRVYVPLCGKTLDMVFLAERAEEVVGVEFVEQAVAEFFDERGLTPRIEREPHIRYNAGPYTLYAADFFDLTAAELGTIDAVFDRASLVALDEPTRVRYAQHLGAILPTGAKVLLVSFDYDQSQMSGPPFAVSNDEVRRLYTDNFEIERLETVDALNDTMRGQGLSSFDASVFKMTRR